MVNSETTEHRAQQEAAEAKKVTTLQHTRTAELTGQDAEQDVPKATADNQTVVNSEKTAELSTKPAAQTTERRAQQKPAEAKKVTTLQKT